MTRAADASSADENFYDLAVREGWTEGLPVAPPTTARIDGFLAAIGKDPSTTVGKINDAGRERSVSYGELAACALMGGCAPEHATVVDAAAQAVFAPEFSLGTLRSSHGALTPLVIVSGNIVQRLEFATGHGIFAGGGKRANMVVGRAIALLVHNLLMRDGDTRHVPDLGGPNLFFSLIAEAPSHWNPLHFDRGCDSDSGVTVIGASTHNGALLTAMQTIIGESFNTMADNLRTLGNMNTQDLGGEAVVCFSQPNMEVLAAEGFSRRDVQDILFQKARRKVRELKRVGIITEERLADMRSKGIKFGYYGMRYDDEALPIVDEPSSILAVPCGGETMWWSCVVHGAGRYGGRAVTRPVAAVA